MEVGQREIKRRKIGKKKGIIEISKRGGMQSMEKERKYIEREKERKPDRFGSCRKIHICVYKCLGCGGDLGT